MPRPKIDLVELEVLLRKGKSQREIAKMFKVSDSAITQARQKLHTPLVRTMAMEKAGQIAQTHLDMAGQMRKINDAINRELDRAQKMIAKGPRDIDDVTKIQRVIVQMAGEIRQQLNAQVEIFEAYRDFKEYERWKEGVLTVLMKYHPEGRNACIQELKEAGLLRGSVEVN